MRWLLAWLWMGALALDCGLGAVAFAGPPPRFVQSVERISRKKVRVIYTIQSEMGHSLTLHAIEPYRFWKSWFHPQKQTGLTSKQEGHIQEMVAEQQDLQKKKPKARGLDDYEPRIFLHDDSVIARPSSESDLPSAWEILKQEVGETNPSLPTLIAALRRNRGRNVLWGDLAGGLGVAVQETGERLEGKLTVLDAAMINIDIVDWGSEGSPTGSGGTPLLVRADATSFRFTRKFDLVTSIGGILYFPDKLKALVHAYNELKPDGLLVISSDSDWPAYMKWKEGPGTREDRPFDAFLRALRQAGIPVGISRARVDPTEANATCTLVVRKIKGTSLRMNTKAQESPLVHQDAQGSTSGDAYVPTYTVPRNRPPVEVVFWRRGPH